MSLSAVEITVRMPLFPGLFGRVPMTSSAFDPIHHQQRPEAHGADRVAVASSIWRARSSGHGRRRWAFVIVWVQVVARKVFPLASNTQAAIIGRYILVQAAQHVEHAIDRAGPAHCDGLRRSGKRVKKRRTVR